MLDAVLKDRALSFRLTVKGLMSVLFVVLAIALPQITHAAGGAQAGTAYMPMYLPPLLAGCVLGWKWGLLVGLASPAVSYAITLPLESGAMPALSRLPYMILELGVFGLVAGAFSGLIIKNALFAFPAVLAAQVAGRTVYFVYNLIAGREFGTLLSSAAASLPGLYLQAIIVPVLAILLCRVIKNARS